MMIGKKPADALKRPRRPVKLRRTALIVSLAIAALLAGFLYGQRYLLQSLLVGTHLVGGSQGAANLHLPPGFHENIFYAGLSSPRFITFAPDGALFVADSRSGSIIALSDPNSAGKAANKKVIASGLNNPTSLVFYHHALYVGEQSQITRFTLGANQQVTSKQVIVPNLPSSGEHVTRTVLVGADGNLYVSIGSSCNDCVESDPHRAAVWIYHLDGSGGRLYARGLRNAVGMAVNPWSKQIWVTVNGRDYLGDNSPPETIYALHDGGNYGWPFCHAGSIIDPELGHPGDCRGVVQPLVKMQAHSAPLGLAFYTAKQFPRRYQGLFVAFHGSWNRSIPTGYKVVFIPLNAQGQVSGSVQDFASGWLLDNNDAIGRPVGLAIGPDGALYLSDDKAGMIYRITYSGQ